MKSRYKLVIQWVIGLGLLVFILINLSIGEIYKSLVNVSWALLVLSLIFQFSSRVIVSYKWFVLARIRHPGLPFYQVLGMHFFGGAVGLVVPFVGPDVAVGYSYYRYSGDASNSISSILVARIIGFYVTLITGIIGVILTLNLLLVYKHFLLIAGFVLASTVLFTFISIYMIHHAERVTPHWIPTRWRELILEICLIMKKYVDNHREALWINLFLSFIVVGFRIAATYTVSLAIGVEASLFYFIAIVPILFLLIQLPISASGLGVEEGASIVLLGLVGVTAEQAFSISMIGRVLTFITAIPGAIWMLTFRDRDTLGSVKSETFSRTETGSKTNQVS